MSSSMEVVLSPEELSEKCACCFKYLHNFTRIFEMSDGFANNFIDLMQAEFISRNYSSRVCGPCHDRVNAFAAFKFTMCENQSKLQDTLNSLGLIQYEVVKSEQLEHQEIDYVEEEHLDEAIIVEERYFDMDDMIEEESREYLDLRPDVKPKVKLEFVKSEEHFTCRLCPTPLSFSSRYRYRVHLKEEHPDRYENKFLVMSPDFLGTTSRETICSKEMCGICGKYITTSSLENHMRRMHSEQYLFFCDLCPQKFKVKRDIQQHVKKHVQTDFRERYQCEFCENTYLTMWALRHHFTMVHAEVSKDFICECGSAFKTKLRLNYHKKVVHAKGEFPCEICQKTYSSLPNLRLHNAQFHRNKEACVECGKMVAPGVYMRRHMRTHEPAQFICEIDNCSKVFYAKPSLVDHQASVHGLGERVDCQYCGASFATKKVLDKHVSRTHTITERVPCEVPGCTHTSARKDYFISHVKTHKDIDEETKVELIAKIKKIKELPW